MISRRVVHQGPPKMGRGRKYSCIGLHYKMWIWGIWGLPRISWPLKLDILFNDSIIAEIDRIGIIYVEFWGNDLQPEVLEGDVLVQDVEWVTWVEKDETKCM